ncbi:cell wall-binding repeat-containing protein [Arthrobacter sp. NEB 688]|uniref:cell wall-binding repeat-containing protein n=1 Tax=Arthrobacter sp. NEB 688 TaxID=904039 RepID=UPI001566CC9E|nr:cell wall-binding repeat-containing protein [Arthrobacter sp. NEB 688]QKE85530.1 SpoIID/LytB domain-containing protein [Arthrobacter sp. NEB 688]
MSRRLLRPLVAATAALALTGGLAPAALAGTVPWGVDQARPAPTAPDGAAPAVAAPAARTAAASSTWTLSGSGWGHGVGMSQYGAMEMARDGYSAAQILRHYYSGTDYTTVDDTAQVLVNLQHQTSSSTFSTSALAAGGGTMTVVAGGTSLTAPAGTTATVTASGSGVAVSCAGCSPTTTATGTTATVYWDDTRTLVSTGGARYKDGSIAVSRTPGSSTLEVVGRMRLHDQYLDYIREVPWSWPAATLQAQAAAARGYALTAVRGGVRSSCACHVYDTVQSQVFGGYPGSGDLPYWKSWQAAVRAAGSGTQGYVVTYKGSVIEAFYASSTGGRTQNSEDVWSSAVPYLRSVDDHWSLRSSNPRRAWVTRPATSTLGSVFGLADVASLDLSSRYASGAVRTATATSSSGARASISGASLQARLGLYSSYVARPTERIDGSNRYAVAEALAATHDQGASTVVIASGEDAGRADAAVAGPLAQALGAPLLLTQQGKLPTQTRAELARRAGSLTRAVVVGGSPTVDDAVLTELRDRGLAVTRLGGRDRFEVSAAVARRVAAERPVGAVVVASGWALADALGAGGPAGAVGEPVLLTRGDRLPDAAVAALTDLRVPAARIVGGTPSVGAAVESDLRSRLSSVRRLDGADRYEVAAAVAAYYLPRLGAVTAVSLSSGEDRALTDALTAGSLGRPILLTRGTALPPATVAALQSMPGLERVVGLGGTVSVSAGVLDAAGDA